MEVPDAVTERIPANVRDVTPTRPTRRVRSGVVRGIPVVGGVDGEVHQSVGDGQHAEVVTVRDSEQFVECVGLAATEEGDQDALRHRQGFPSIPRAVDTQPGLTSDRVGFGHRAIISRGMASLVARLSGRRSNGAYPRMAAFTPQVRR